MIKYEEVIFEQKQRIEKLVQKLVDMETKAYRENPSRRAYTEEALEARRKAEKREAEREFKEFLDGILNNKVAHAAPMTLRDQLLDQVKREFRDKIISVDDSTIIREFIARFVHDREPS
jgi:hypothetical protein